MWKRLLPDVCLDAFREITPAFLQEQGIRGLILDIDNTLVPYEIAEPTPEVLAWLASLTEAGISYAFVSNNHRDRVEKFCRELQAFYVFDSHKPLRGALRRAQAELGCPTHEICAVGDQVFTDVYAAKRMGFRAILLPPIRDKRDLFTRFKRLLERPVRRAYAKRQKRRSQVESGD